MDERYFAGIDGGGTKTECAIVDQRGNVVAIGRGGPSNTNYVSVESAVQSVTDAINEALSKEMRVSAVGCTHIRESGLRVKSVIAGMLGEVIEYSEGEAALACAGFFGKFGISQISGTGSNTYGYDADGNELLGGGWGALLGDQGSGYDMALRGLRSAVLALDSMGSETVLLEKAAGHFGLEVMRESFKKFALKNLSRHEIASFSTMVTSAAIDGDEVAIDIVSKIACENSNAIIQMAKRLFYPEDSFPVALHGGVFNDETITQKVIDSVKDAYPNADIRRPIYPAAVGLALLVRNNTK